MTPNDVPPNLGEQLRAAVPEAPDVSSWPAQIERRVASQRRRTALQVVVVAVIAALAAGVAWRTSDTWRPDPTKNPVVVATPSQAASTESPTPTVTESSPSIAAATAGSACDTPAKSQNPQTLSTKGAWVEVWWCVVGSAALYQPPVEPLQGDAVQQVVHAYNAMQLDINHYCSSAQEYQLIFVDADGHEVRLDAGLECETVGARTGSAKFFRTVGAAFDLQRSADGLPEVDPQGCIPRASALELEASQISVAFRCKTGQPVALPTSLVASLAAGGRVVPDDVVPQQIEGVRIVAYTAAGDPIQLIAVRAGIGQYPSRDNMVWARVLSRSGDPSSVVTWAWTLTPSEFQTLVG